MYRKLPLNGSGRNVCGFTLIEVAISMMILGVIMASGLSAYQVYRQKQEMTKTTQVVQTVNQALQTFKSNFGRYPCPAPILEPRNSPNYGREVKCDGSVTMIPSPPPPPLPDLPPLNTQNGTWNCTFNYFIGINPATYELIYDPNGPYCVLKYPYTTNFSLYTKYMRYARLGGQISGDLGSFQNYTQNICLTYGPSYLVCKRNKLQEQVNNYNLTLNDNYDYTNDLLTVSSVAPPSFSTPFPITYATQSDARYDRLLSLVSPSSDLAYSQSDFNTGNYDCLIDYSIKCNIARITLKIDAYNDDIQTLINGQPGPDSDPATSILPGQCLSGGTPSSPTVNGICVEQSDRLDIPNRNIRVGTIPFRDMQLDEKDTLDGYGNRLVYAVTQDMAKVDTFRENGGGIRIIDSTGADLSNGPQSAAYVVFSSGKNGNGAVNANGIANACNGNGGDSENCRDYSFGAAGPGANMAATYRMDVTGNNFDDTMAYFVASENPLWRRTAPTSESVTDLSQGNVGVGIADPAQITDTLTVGQSSVNYTNDSAQYGRLANVNGDVAFQTGSLRVGDGNTANNKIFAPQYCDQNGANCFRVENIAAPYDPTQVGRGMGGCPAGQYMTGIEAGAAKCAAVRFYCTNPDEVFIGFNADGTPNCTLPNNKCDAGFGELCGVSYSLTMGGHNTPHTLTAPNNCAKKTYTCNNGTWQVNSGPGYPASAYDSAHCSYNQDSAMANTLTKSVSCSLTLGEGYTGNATQDYYIGCDGEQVNAGAPDNSACLCQPVYKTEEYPCSGNLTSEGTIHRIKYKLCNGNQLASEWSYKPWQVGGTVSEDGQSITGGTLLSSLGTDDPSGACSCNIPDKIEFASCDGGGTRQSSPSPSSFSVDPYSWPADTSIGKWRHLSANINQCKYNDPAWNDSNCTKMEESDPDCAVGCYKTQTKKKVRKVRSGDSWIDDPDTSGNSDGTCIARTYIWKPGSNPTNSGTGAYTGQAYPHPNDACSCDQVEKVSACLVTTTTGYTFFACTCRESN